MMRAGTLDVARVLGGARIMVLGGTGFLGKLFCSMLVDRYPGVGRIYLVVRPKGADGRTPDARFASEVAPSEAFDPVRRAHGPRYDEFVRDKIVPIDGDMSRPLCGLGEARVRQLRSTIDAVINVAGVVDFNPALDDALSANAFGAVNLVELARALGGVPVFHTSTCYVAGCRPGPILEEDPRIAPFPRADTVPAELWDPDREIAECLDLIAQAKRRADDAFRQSEFDERARSRLLARGEPTVGLAYERELAIVRRAFVRERITQAGLERATHWGWPNIYTYTKAIGEQVIAGSGLPFTLVRPAACESTVAFPVRAYNDGVNTSAPLIYLIMKGEPQILGQHVPLDLIPADYVVAGMILALAELLEGSHKPVYHFGAADVNPCSVQRFGELVGLYKRAHYRGRPSGSLLWDALQARYEPTFVDRARFDLTGAPARAKAMRRVASFVRMAAPALASVAEGLDAAARRDAKVAEIQTLFEPFTSMPVGPFDCSNVRAAHGRLSEEDKRKLPWAPESIDWADWMMNTHMPAMQRRIIPQMDRRLKKERAPLSAHSTLVSLVEEMAERHRAAIALQRWTDDGLTRTSFSDVQRGAEAMAARLEERGVRRGDRVAISGENDPDWVLAYFGILRAGATAVPVDPALDAAGWRDILAESGALVVVCDETVAARDELATARPDLVWFDVHAAVEPSDALDAPLVEVEPGDVASIIFVGGAAERAKGVILTHANFTSLVAALAPVFPLRPGDAVLSALPLHHTFEFTCGLLLAFSRGARFVTVRETDEHAIAQGLRASRAAAVVGVPALWRSLERRILHAADARGPLARVAFDVAIEVNRWLAATLGADAGRFLFGEVHTELGGNVRWLISGGGGLPVETQRRFAGLGLRLTQGYGLTEVAPGLAGIVGRMTNSIPPTDPDGDLDVEPRLRVVAPDLSSSVGPVRAAIAATVAPAQPSIVLPEPARAIGKAVVGAVQDAFYEGIMRPRISGRAHVPHNRSVIVVANHSSHLDMGLVRHALGSYGDGMVSLAAQDYFFEHGITRAFFENLTNLKAFDRRASLRQAIRQASEVIEGGKTVLIFPEGTRSPTGEMRAFRPFVGHLALLHRIDILPIYLGGTHAAMPKGAVVPMRREVFARIGLPLCIDDLQRRTGGMTSAGAAREVARIAQAAVTALGEGQMLDLSRAGPRLDFAGEREHPMVRLFSELEGKFRAGETERPVSYYVTLGSDDLAKWTVRVDSRECEVRRGKPSGPADCVLKTSPEIFTKIVREAYVPSPADFLSGAFKSNDAGLLMTFQRVFRLDRAS
jgi:long-chain acyl-CoA synthetase